MNFKDLGLTPEFLRALDETGYTVPTPIQLKAIPLALGGGDLIASAQTGTGKTAAFGLPLLQRLVQGTTIDMRVRKPRALILTPTRELAAQVEQSLREYARYTALRSACIFGGVGIQPQIKAIARGLDILVATPGRLIDHIQQRTVDLSAIRILVLDEADRMLDMGFLPAIRRILSALPRDNRQTLLFSATFPDPIRVLAKEFMRTPAEVSVAAKNCVAQLVTHRVHPVAGDSKRELLTQLLRETPQHQTLVFARTKHGADRIATQLQRSGIEAAAIHGDKSQGARTKALDSFKRGRIGVLVATDIAARGIDIDQLPRVINVDLPHVAEDYVHRIGRTGRAGASGEAISLVSREESKQLAAIEKLIGQNIERISVAGFEHTLTAGGQSRVVRSPSQPRSPGPPRNPNGARRGAPPANGPQSRRRNHGARPASGSARSTQG